MLKFFIDQASSKIEDLLIFVRDVDEFENFIGDKVLYKLRDCFDELDILKKYLEFE